MRRQRSLARVVQNDDADVGGDATAVHRISFGSEKQSHVRAVLATPRVLRPQTFASSRSFHASFPAQIIQNSELLQAGDFFGDRVSISDSVPAEVQNILFDPQTSGGLLIFSQPDEVQKLLDGLHASGVDAVEVGSTAAQAEHLVIVT